MLIKSNIILDSNGRVFVSRKDNTEHYELRFMKDCWYSNAGGQWDPWP